MRALAGVARGVGLGDHLLLGRGEESTGGRDKSSILADAVEALIGAVYLQDGLDAARDLVRRLVGPLVEQAAQLGAGLDWKTSLQELSSAQGLGVPEYVVVESGPDHAKTFTAEVVLAGASWGTGSGRSKKEAEQGAARAAWNAVSAPPAAG
jgi:ribonuclease-3